MPRLSTSVRIAATSVLLLSVLHTIFWGYMAFSLRAQLPSEFPYNYIFPVMTLFSVIGLIGVFVGLGLFNGRNWARIATLALAAVGAFFCVFAIAVIFGLLFIPGSTTELGLHRDDSLRVILIYLLVFLVTVWWIILFSRQSVAAQFASNASSALPSAKEPACPPPIALLALRFFLRSVSISRWLFLTIPRPRKDRLSFRPFDPVSRSWFSGQLRHRQPVIEYQPPRTGDDAHVNALA